MKILIRRWILIIRPKLYHLLIIFTILGSMSTVVAEDSTSSIRAINIHITYEYVEASGVCSCSLMEDRKHHHATFQNYCPACGHKGTLNFEEGPAGITSPEGLWVCTYCDADYCLIHGKEHIEGTKWYLKPYHKPSTPQKNNLDMMKEKWNSHQQQGFMNL